MVEFEDPAKTQLRESFTQAMDASGHTLVCPPESIPLPPDSEWKGTIRPDIQSEDGEGYSYNLYVRPGQAGHKAVPQWLANIARSSHRLSKTLVYVAVESTGEELETSCRTVGAGLIVLRDGLRLDQVIDPRESSPAQVSAQLKARVSSARLKLINKQDIKLNATQDYYNTARSIFPEKKGEKYLDDAETVSLEWRSWSENLSTRLDAVIVSGDLGELAAIEAEIEAGIL